MKLVSVACITGLGALSGAAAIERGVDVKDAVAAIARSIVSHSSDCYKKHADDQGAYEQCTADFCHKQCSGGSAASGCDDVCSRNAAALFQKFSSPHVAESARLRAVAKEAAGEQAAALAELSAAHRRMAALNRKIALRAAREMRSGDTARGRADMAKAQQLESLRGEISKHVAKITEFSDMAGMKRPRAERPSASFLQRQTTHRRKPEDDLAKEMTHDLEMNFNKIAPFGKEDTAKELQDHAAKTQDTLVDAVENAEVAEIKRAVFRALTRLRAATIKEFDTIARLETQAIDAYNDAHHYRAENPLAHLHEDEAPVETDKLKSFH
eukprot:CAMPEP_0176216732 /NCGR_PEP_ID=MMETSP0121_2-20121125/17336_1 /TAXON_ID=160619 /ORGANISM="Kryptoperidinium foliaceum, Strain CCMP 1326" /LENGTH=325 /DNA_ID=CAMNT_0017555855 /DNA_START=76 /DNA_END=1053 /DNA_ORIENTATION=+